MGAPEQASPTRALPGCWLTATASCRREALASALPPCKPMRLSEAQASMLAREDYRPGRGWVRGFRAACACTVYRGRPPGLIEEEDGLYSWLVEEWNLRDDLLGIAQVSSYLRDEDLYRAHAQEERWWESLFHHATRADSSTETCYEYDGGRG